MSALGTTMSTCPALQGELTELFRTCDTAMIGFGSPFADFLMSPENRGGLQQLLNPGDGRIRSGIVRYDQSLTPAETGTFSADISCTAETKRGDLTAPYELDTEAIVFKEELMNPFDWEATCRGNREIILRKLAILMKAVREGTYKKLAEEFVNGAMWGQWGQLAEDDNTNFTITADELVVQTKKTGTIDPYPTTLQTIANALMLTGYCANPFHVGGLDLKSYFEVMQTGCCTSSGFGLDRIWDKFGFAYAWDKWLTAALGTNNLSVALMPGALQIVGFNKFAGTVAVDDALSLSAGGKNYTQFVIIDPISRLPMNVRISDNCGNISIFIFTQTQLFAMPRDMFAAGNDLDGVTFVNKIRVTNT